MGLLEKLAQDKPYTAKGVRHPQLMSLVRKHYGEIQEALSRRYSWTQICKRAYEAWQDNGELSYENRFRNSLLYNYYRQVKKEQANV